MKAKILPRLLLPLALTLAAPLHAQVSVPYDSQGTLGWVDAAKQRMVIGEGEFIYNRRLEVWSRQGAPISPSELSAGQDIGYNFHRNGNGYPTISEIWVLR